MKQIDPNEVHTFQIDLKQYVNEIKWDSHFKEHFHGNQTKIMYGSIQFTGTYAQVNEFLDKMPDDESQYKLIGLTNLSDVLIDVESKIGDHVRIRCENQLKVAHVNDLANIFLDAADLPRMEANFSRGTNFRTWIRRSDFEAITNQFI